MKNSRKLVDVLDAIISGHVLPEERLPRMSLSLPPSGLTELVARGGKCAHGVYIPAGSEGEFGPDIAPYCTICHPLVILTKEDAVYRA